MQSDATVWKIGSTVGTILIIVGVSAGYVDMITEFRYPFISNRFGIFLLSTIVGILMAFVCVIGWARHLRPSTRAKVAAIVLPVPWLALMAGYPIAGANIHGPATLLMFMVGPASVLLGLVLLIMAAL
jgi:hypothetical protein